MRAYSSSFLLQVLKLRSLFCYGLNSRGIERQKEFHLHNVELIEKGLHLLRGLNRTPKSDSTHQKTSPPSADHIRNEASESNDGCRVQSIGRLVKTQIKKANWMVEVDG